MVYNISKFYLLISKDNYNGLPIPRSYMLRHGSHLIDENGTLLTGLTVRQAVEGTPQIQPVRWMKFESGKLPEDVAEDEATHCIVSIQEMNMKEIRDIEDLCDQLGITHEVILSQKDMLDVIKTGIFINRVAQ